jgi:hypothetical protein
MGRVMTHFDLSRLSSSERTELAELQRQFDAAPVLVDLARLNILQGKATSPELTYRAYRQTASLRKHQRQT